MKHERELAAWKEQLRAALVTLEKSPGAPIWLQQVLRDAMTVAADLAPAKKVASATDTFIYPH